MSKLFQMHDDLFMEVTPQPWMMNSGLIKTQIENGRVFCVNLRTGQLTSYLPEAPRPVFTMTRNGVSVVLPDDYAKAEKVIIDYLNAHSATGLIISSDQMVYPVGFPTNRSIQSTLKLIQSMYTRAYNKAENGN